MAIKQVQTTCAYCGAGCQILFTVDTDKNRILKAEPANGRTNEGTLCLKGRYGWDYLNDPQILTKRITEPMIRKNGELVPVEWDEAIRYVAKNLSRIKAEYGPDSIMVTGCARGSGNEANYIAQKFARACIGTNNIDHCARVCHGPSVAGLLYSLGEGAMSLGVHEIEDAEVIFNIGYNSAESHPIVHRRVIAAKQKGAKIICADPRVIETAKIADLHLQIKGGSNLALVNAMANVIYTEGLMDEGFIAEHTEGFDEFVEVIKKYTPEFSEPICRIPADDIRRAARIYASSKHSVILWGMGVTQFGQAVDVVKACANLAMMTGNFGRWASGVGPVRGQNNVQGACDMGVLPNNYPGYQSVTNPEVKAKFEKAWGVALSGEVGLQLTRVPQRVLGIDDPKKRLHAYYIFGEDPGQSDPHLGELRETLDALDFVVVQDIFMNKTIQHADVVLPGTAWGEHDGVYTCCDRGFQRIRKVLEPTGNVKPDWQILCEISTAMGYPMSYKNTEEIWNELIDLCPNFAGATYEKLEKLNGVQWPCRDKSMADTGTSFLHKDGVFAHPGGKGRFYATEWRSPIELENEEFPLSFCTVREVGHYSVRTMSGNCRALRGMEDEPGWIQMSIEDCEALGIKTGDLVKVVNKRGWCLTRALATERVAKGATYMTYQWWIGACNELTVGKNLDPIAGTPEFKYCNCRVEKIDDQEWAEKYLLTEYRQLRERMGIKCIGEQRVGGVKAPATKGGK